MPLQLDATIFERNWDALRRHQARAAQRLAGIEAYSPSQLAAAKSGDPVISLAGEDGVERPLHSRYQPRTEAAGQLPKGVASTSSSASASEADRSPEEVDAVVDPLATYVLLGGGLGYLAAELLPRLSAENRVLWIERDLRLFRTLLEWVDVSQLLERPATRIVLGENTDDLNWELYRDLSNLLAAPMFLLGHPASLQLWPQGYGEVRKVIDEFTRKGPVLMRTTLFLARRSMVNQSQNLATYLESPGLLSLKDVLKGKPCIVVSAGPSLQRNIEQLRKAQGHITIIAVSTALKPVLSRGVRPDFTVLLDYHQLSQRYFEGIPAEEAPAMVCALKASPHALDCYSGVKLFSNDYFFNTLIEGTTGDFGDLEAASTVAQMALHLASFLGADPVILAGQDLSYPGGLVHVPGTAIQTQEFPLTHRFYSFEMRELEYYFRQRSRFLKVPSVDGGEVPTDEIFFTYLRQFEEHVKRYPAQFIDATEGGALIAGTEIATLADVVDRFSHESTPDYRTLLREAEAAVPLEERQRKALRVLEERRQDSERLADIYESLLELLDEIVDRNEAGEVADAQVREVLELHKESKEFGRVYLLLSQLAQSDLWLRFRADRRIEVSEETGVGRQLLQARRDRDFVRGIAQARHFLAECLEVAQREIEGKALVTERE